MSALVWTIGEAHREAREEILRRLQRHFFEPGAPPPVVWSDHMRAICGRREVLLLVFAHQELSGDTHTLVIDEDSLEVWMGRIDRSGRKYLH